jgi:hypothetical protein
VAEVMGKLQRETEWKGNIVTAYASDRRLTAAYKPLAIDVIHDDTDISSQVPLTCGPFNLFLQRTE